MNFPKQGLNLRQKTRVEVVEAYVCRDSLFMPLAHRFKKSFKSSWTTSCNSNQLEVTLFAINLPFSYWYTGLYRVSMLHVPPPGQRGDKNLSSSSSNNKRLKIKIEKNANIEECKTDSGRLCVFLPKHGDIKRTTVMRRRLNPRHQ